MRDETSNDEPDGENWNDDGDDDATIPCPECGAAIFDDADQCPRCGYWVLEADRDAAGVGARPSRRVRAVAIALLVLFAAMLLMAGSMF